VNWSATGSGCSGASCGTFSSQTTASGSPVTYTAPATAGQFTITATSVNDASAWSSVPVGVTDLTGVATYHNNTSRNGVNSQEYALSPADVTPSTFGKLFSCPVDGAIYAQPLWVSNLTIGGAQHNVIRYQKIEARNILSSRRRSGNCPRCRERESLRERAAAERPLVWSCSTICGQICGVRVSDLAAWQRTCGNRDRRRRNRQGECHRLTLHGVV
jgi:hypothetical protein